MSSKRTLIAVGVILILLLLLGLIYMLVPQIKIELNDKRNMTILVGDEYEEPGATAYLRNGFKKEALSLDIEGAVDTNKIGKYLIFYKVHGNESKKEIRVVNVVDKTDPEIILNSEIKGCKNNKVFDMDVKVTDNYDGDITDKLQYKINKDKIYFSVADNSNNKTTLTKDIVYIDSEKPSITLNGAKTIYLNLNSSYNDPGVKAVDSCEGDLTEKVVVENNIKNDTIGEYEVKYSVSDSLGNKSEVVRKVIVVNDNEHVDNVTDGTIYLTFDDGPGPYTTQILDILDKYNIKATFFVTAQFSNYLDKIKDEYDRGHTVGIHTYTHKWSVYDSVDTYLNDFNKMEQIVYEKTGVHPKYFRFPGGTSNEVSIKHSKGIMTTLSKLMTEKGYTYFDWNVDCGDTHANTSVDYIIKTTKTYVKGNGSYIILMHDIKKNTRDALPTLIEYFQNKGYVFKAIDENTPLKQFAPHN